MTKVNPIHTYVVLAYKESNYLEECIKSVLHQSNDSTVVIATSSPNKHIEAIANKYNLSIHVNPDGPRGIGYDFDFAVSCGKTKLVTVAHQDDLYDKDYASAMIEGYKLNPDSIILFSDYYEIRDQHKVYSNTNLKIKRLLLTPLKVKFLAKRKFGKRLPLRFGCAICCPAVTFVKSNIRNEDIFKCDFKCDIDWYAWEKLSKLNGSFSYIKEPLMGHRVHEESTTSEIIQDNIRTKEDLEMFKKFWPRWIANQINKVYVKSEKSND